MCDNWEVDKLVQSLICHTMKMRFISSGELTGVVQLYHLTWNEQKCERINRLGNMGSFQSPEAGLLLLSVCFALISISTEAKSQESW